MTKTLAEAAQDLLYATQKFHDTRMSILDGSLLFARECPTCHKLITDRNDLYSMAELGECLRCDHVRGEEVSEHE